MSAKWVCIDDDKANIIQPYLDQLSAAAKANQAAAQAGETLDFDRWQPSPLDKLLERLQAADPDGVLIDLRLDEVANEAGERVAFRGLTFAQELRTRMTEGGQRAIPIVLWSVDGKLQSSYAADNTGHDLADRVYVKDRDVVHRSGVAAAEMLALEAGYKAVAGAVAGGPSAVWKLLDLQDDEVAELDGRILEGLLARNRQVAHEWASLIVRELLERPGPLVDDAIVAARLGVDPNSTDWPALWTLVHEKAGYSGVFSLGWPRVWNHRMIGWWESIAGENAIIQRLPAVTRVEVLKRALGLDLRPAEPIAQDYSTRYWTLCRGYKRALDPADGVLALVPDLKPWQDKYYLSVQAALERVGRDEGWRPHVLELPRLDALAASKQG